MMAALGHGRDNVRLGAALQRARGAQNRARVLDALVRASGGYRAVSVHDVRAATRVRGVGLALTTVQDHLRALVAEGRAHLEGSGQHWRWRPSAIVSGERR